MNAFSMPICLPLVTLLFFWLVGFWLLGYRNQKSFVEISYKAIVWASDWYFLRQSLGYVHVQFYSELAKSCVFRKMKLSNWACIKETIYIYIYMYSYIYIVMHILYIYTYSVYIYILYIYIHIMYIYTYIVIHIIYI